MPQLVITAALLVVGAVIVLFIFNPGSSDSLDLEIIETKIWEIPFCDDGALPTIDDQFICEEKAEPEFEIFDVGRGISCIEITRLGQAVDWECVK